MQTKSKKEMLLNRLNKLRQKIYLSGEVEPVRTFEDDFCKITIEIKEVKNVI